MSWEEFGKVYICVLFFIIRKENKYWCLWIKGYMGEFRGYFKNKYNLIKVNIVK